MPDYRVVVPLVDVTYDPRVGEDALRQLAETLPHEVSVAVECPEEPYDHELAPGDVEVRFRERGPYDVSGLDVVVEVRSKWFASRADSRQERCDRLTLSLAAAVRPHSLGVYLSLPVAAWAQHDEPAL